MFGRTLGEEAAATVVRGWDGPGGGHDPRAAQRNAGARGRRHVHTEQGAVGPGQHQDTTVLRR